MSYRKILTIQDISCVGQCSLTVALPILSAAGMETCILPSAVLSTHTAGFSGYTVRDLTADIPGIAAHWKKENIRFDALYTGYLGSTEQIAYVRRIAAELLSEGGAVIVDPAMADNGKLYPAFDAAYVEAMKSLAFSADIILPTCGAKTVVLTGVGFDAEHTGVIVREGGETRYYEHRKIAKGCHGTGDVYAAAFVGALENGVGAYEAAVLAADYTVRCIELTQGDAAHWYGVKFELALPEFIRMLGK